MQAGIFSEVPPPLNFWVRACSGLGDRAGVRGRLAPGHRQRGLGPRPRPTRRGGERGGARQETKKKDGLKSSRSHTCTMVGCGPHVDVYITAMRPSYHQVMNAESSRSHTVFTLRLQCTTTVPDGKGGATQTVQRACGHLQDSKHTATSSLFRSL